MKILFIVPSWTDDFGILSRLAHLKYSQPPLGPLYIAGLARDHGHEVGFYDGDAQGFCPEDLAEQVIRDGIDLVAAKEKGIVVTHTPGVLTDDVADLAFGLVLSMGRRIPQADRFVRNGDWVSDLFPLTHKVSGATLGIVGMGRIGQAIAKRAVAFDMRISYTSRDVKSELPYTFHSTVEALAEAVDYLVVAVPGGDDTKNLIGASVLQALGARGVLINIARGSVVNQPVLVQALKDKTIAGAALDVFWDEPIVDPELRRLPNVVLTPHIASATEETRRAMAALTMDNLRAFYAKQALPTPVPECR